MISLLGSEGSMIKVRTKQIEDGLVTRMIIKAC